MTELGDYRRLVEAPMIRAKDAEIERLRAEMNRAYRQLVMDKPSEAKDTIAKALDEQQSAKPCGWCGKVHEGACDRLISGGQSD